MSVNPNLATLMSLVEDLQDQMPEGKYLEAMNALCDLHKNPSLRPTPPPAPYQVPEGRVQLTQFESNRYEVMERTRREIRDTRSLAQQEYEGNRFLVMACEEANITPVEWVSLEVSAKIPIIKNALEKMVNAIKPTYDVIDPEVCPFIARHAFGRWQSPHNPKGEWDCVCGAKNIKSKNWRQHEVSDKHQGWHNGGRLITKPKQKAMEKYVNPSYTTQAILGVSTEYVSHTSEYNRQTPNEWTTPYSKDHTELRLNNPSNPNFTEWKTACEQPDHTNDPLTFKISPHANPVLRPAPYIHNLPPLPHTQRINSRVPYASDNWITLMRLGDYPRFIAMMESE
jgi:hypothetical protein